MARFDVDRHARELERDGYTLLLEVMSPSEIEATKRAIDETLEAVIQEDGSVKRIKFTDRIKEETQDIPKDQVAARLDAEFSLMSAEMCAFVNFLSEALDLDKDS